MTSLDPAIPGQTLNWRGLVSLSATPAEFFGLVGTG
jgi:hypothetical protein